MSRRRAGSAPGRARPPSEHAHWFLRAKPFLKAAQDTLESLYYARQGGPVSMGLAVASAAAAVMEHLVTDNPWAVFGKEYTARDQSVQGFLFDALKKTGDPGIILGADTETEARWWNEFTVGFIESPDHLQGPYFRSTLDDRENFAQKLGPTLWAAGSELALVPRSDGSHHEGREYDLDPMHPINGKYVPEIDRTPQWFANRAQLHDNRPRTFLFRGPTGVGKSVMARLIARELNPENPRVLKIDSMSLKNVRQNQLLSFIFYMRPSVLLLDDLDLTSALYSDQFLALLEAIRDPRCLVIATMMTGIEKQGKPKPGSWHFPGMRPDRIDEMFTFYPPDMQRRAKILQSYMGPTADLALVSEIACRTDGLTGAYLMEIAHRLLTHGTDEWEHEVESVMWAAPVARPNEEAEGES